MKKLLQKVRFLIHRMMGAWGNWSLYMAEKQFLKTNEKRQFAMFTYKSTQKAQTPPKLLHCRPVGSEHISYKIPLPAE